MYVVLGQGEARCGVGKVKRYAMALLGARHSEEPIEETAA